MSFDIMPYVVIEMQTVKTYPLSLSKRGISAYLMCCAMCFPITSFGSLDFSGILNYNSNIIL